MRRALLFCLAACLLFARAPRVHAGDWDAWRFLVGDWAAQGGGEPGQGAGSVSFKFDLQGKILVRRDRTDYAATKDRPAFSHEDLMVIYPEPGGTGARAVYFDNEGHVIQYSAKFSEDQKTLTFLSDAAPSSPRFRLTYTKDGSRALAIKFEVAPPDKPEAFSTYVQGVARRVQPRPGRPRP